eukprot:COSAG01_NODE_1078_length_11825_cov_5.863636_9_plen_74_part_00
MFMKQNTASKPLFRSSTMLVARVVPEKSACSHYKYLYEVGAPKARLVRHWVERHTHSGEAVSSDVSSKDGCGL